MAGLGMTCKIDGKFETVRRAAAEAGLSPGGLFLGELLTGDPLPDAHEARRDLEFDGGAYLSRRVKCAERARVWLK